MDRQELTREYERKSDDELFLLASNLGDLTQAAQDVLSREMRKRQIVLQTDTAANSEQEMTGIHGAYPKYCTSCGIQVHDSALSCVSCGALIQHNRYSAKSWLSFSGRIPRSTYWLYYALPDSVIGFLILILAARLPDSITTAALLMLLLLAVCSHQLAGDVKRAHDRGHSGWFVLLGLVPILNVVVGIQLCFMRGEVGPNLYGPDPLASERLSLSSQAGA